MAAISHSARLTPFQPETVWTLDAGTLTETRGKIVRRFPLSSLTRYRLASAPPDRQGRDTRRRVLTLSFGRAKVVMTAQSYAGPGRFEDRLASFSTLARALAAVGADLSPRARFGVARLRARAALTWVMGLLGLGIAAMLLFSLTAGMAGVGIDMAARMGFVLILILAVLPWLGGGSDFDPHDPPADLLP